MHVLSFTLLHLVILEIQTCTRSQLCPHEIALSAFYLISLSILFTFPFSSDTHLSFEFPHYYVSEEGTGTGVYQIYIIKEEGQNPKPTRSSFEFYVQLRSTDKAMEGVYFYAPDTHLAIRPSEEKYPFIFQIINDDIIEGLENFTLSISPIGNIVQWKEGLMASQLSPLSIMTVRKIQKQNN